MATATKRKSSRERLTLDKYFNLIEHAADGIAIIQDGVFKLVNTALARISGYDKEELLGMPFTKLLTPESQKLTVARYQARLAGKKVPPIYEVKAVTKEGEIRHIEINAALTEYEGRVADEAIVRDITERKRVEEALRESEEKFKTIFENVNDEIIYLDKYGKIIDINNRVEGIFGYKRDEVIGKHFTRLGVFSLKDLPKMAKLFREVAKGKPIPLVEMEAKRKDGSILIIEASTGVLKEDGKVQGILIIARDITERKKREQLQNSENYVLTLLGQGAELSELLDAIVRLGEYHDPSIKGSVLLFDSSKERLFQASAPSLPDSFKELLENGLPIGPNVGSCGTAAYLKERVIVPDIAKSPLFKPFKEVVKRTVNNSLLAVWSQPIIASNGDLLGTIANYSNKVGEPSDDNLRVLEWSARIAAIAIERKQAEEQLRESEEKLRTYLESAPDGVYINDLKGTFLYGNKKAEEIIGYKKEELIGKSFLKLNLLPAKYLAKAGKLLALNAMGKSTRPEELELIRKDGTRVWVEISTTPIKQKGKTVVLGFVRDITERKQMEQQLQEKNEQLDAQNEELRAINEELRATEEQLQQSQEKLERMFESVTEGIIVANLDGTILKVNEKTAQMLGFASDDGLLGKTAIELVVSRDRERIADNVRKALKEGLIRSQEYTLLRADGSEFPGELSTSALKDASGKVIGHITIVRDITERKQMEEKDERLQQELDLTSRLASIGQMASGVAHEINNPLTGVIGFSHLLMSRDIPSDMKQDLQVINSEAQRVAKIVENLLTFARQRKPGRECVVINNIIARVIELRAYEMKVNNIEVETQLAPDLPCTMADAGQLQQVFLNIILNAEHFMTKAHNRGKLLVKTERIHGNIRASFTDDGPGIIKENLDKVFNPFFTTKEVGSGTGLGLSICHGIITQHKGRIYAQSKLGQGATFVVELPIVDEPTWAGQAKVTKEEPQKPRGAKILVVDDEPAILAFLRRLLTEWGHSVETINNADAALERLKTERYSLILLDIKLPGMSGIELYHHIEEIAPALTRRIMFITGDVMETATRDFLDRTKAPHITKPLNIEMLKKTINHTLNQTHIAATTPG